MLSDEEKRELKAMAHDPKVREEFEMLRKAALRFGQDCPIDVYVSFLDCLPRIQAVPPLPHPFPIYTNVRL
ncbi:MAG TPA: hypothetical protein DDX89_05395 [Candidatus Omnitrophica bacterium]|nr:MAG: hypothetical protein A2Z92_05130 [Omnitrophica WOR_2 bacterium GWA2_63_20]OGX16829.1 MAG: hypothetical protein A2105_02510 [Omnitrophica WOR_2 bacterium GWF2_63_9]OGX32139.1 MAG: hypothetical protein A3E56_04715 [Omnitrophica WOR_2 bacterium RIFCSPHIGHO2_12_FULL_64_13]OGX35135.1 MAG: hypothetical protein A3B73_02150 [Omnitrophica WOR_2 bacterium RIFCSPHIGHO2_02_FULL_63_39]OGX45581.1 MAG: hypothetical protein A3I71_01865 [Omnitrophica WOR_2 bacterium RIFCSPLOWO2_02_FULL_63_16]OGX48463.1